MKMLSKYFIIAPLFVASALFFSSCTDKESYDVTGSSQNIVFINTQAWSPVNVNNGFLFNVEKTPLGNTLQNADQIQAKFTVQCTHPASEDITVKLEADNSDIPSGYIKLPNGMSLKLDRAELVIPKGSTIAKDSVTISIDKEQIALFDTGMYMAPVKIASVSNAASSNSYKSACFVINTAYTNCINNTTSLAGTSAARTGWTATIDNVDQANKFFDGNTRTYTQVATFPFSLEVDLASVHNNIVGFAFTMYSASYAMASANVYTSETGKDNYKLQGKVSFVRTASQYIKFYEKVNARYVKIEVLAPANTSVVLAEFYTYQ